MGEHPNAAARYLSSLRVLGHHPVAPMEEIREFFDAAYSAFGLDEQAAPDFSAFVAARASHFADRGFVPPKERAKDLFWAHLCLEGKVAHLTTLRRACQPSIRKTALKVRTPEEDLEQATWERLLCSTPPKLSEYEARGSLVHFVSMVASRIAIDQSRKQTESLGKVDVSVGIEAADVASDPELLYFRALYKRDLSSVLREAASQLQVEERMLLRSHFVHHATIDDLAKVLGCHRSSAARKLSDARDALSKAVHRRLAEKHGLSKAEWESAMRIVQSRMEVSMRQLFETESR